ncbi:hypothetical protein FGB62_7g653 [Gracilaria domingensis]|nr:hypothetical protein FGB62_7g653 [Gracilaria domingensis]
MSEAVQQVTPTTADGDEPSQKRGLLFRLSYAVDRSMRTAFFRLGYIVAARPALTIALSIFVVLLSLIGLLRFRSESRADQLWVPQGTTALANREYVVPNYGSTVRFARIAFEARDGDGLANKDAFLEMLQVAESGWQVTAPPSTEEGADNTIITWPERCLSTTDTAGNKLCTFISAFTLFYDIDNVVKNEDDTVNFFATVRQGIEQSSDEDIKNLLSNPPATNQLGVPFNAEEIIGGTSGSGSNFDFKIMLFTQLINNNQIEKDGDRVDVEADDLEEAWTTFQLETSPLLDGSTLDWFVESAWSQSDSLSEALSGDLPLLGFGFVLLAIYVIFFLGDFHIVRSHMWLAVGALITTGLALGVCFGLSSAFGMFFGPVHQILPLLIIGIGIDDCFHVTRAYDDLNLRPGSSEKPLRLRIALALSASGSAITVTSFTNVVVFLLSAISRLPALRFFALWAAIGILFAWAFSITFFTACLTLDARRQEAKRRDCCPLFFPPVAERPEHGGEPASSAGAVRSGRSDRKQRVHPEGYGGLLVRGTEGSAERVGRVVHRAQRVLPSGGSVPVAGRRTIHERHPAVQRQQRGDGVPLRGAVHLPRDERRRNQRAQLGEGKRRLGGLWRRGGHPRGVPVLVLRHVHGAVRRAARGDWAVAGAGVGGGGGGVLRAGGPPGGGAGVRAGGGHHHHRRAGADVLLRGEPQLGVGDHAGAVHGHCGGLCGAHSARVPGAGGEPARARHQGAGGDGAARVLRGLLDVPSDRGAGGRAVVHLPGDLPRLSVPDRDGLLARADSGADRAVADRAAQLLQRRGGEGGVGAGAGAARDGRRRQGGAGRAEGVSACNFYKKDELLLLLCCCCTVVNCTAARCPSVCRTHVTRPGRPRARRAARARDGVARWRRASAPTRARRPWPSTAGGGGASHRRRAGAPGRRALVGALVGALRAAAAAAPARRRLGASRDALPQLELAGVQRGRRALGLLSDLLDALIHGALRVQSHVAQQQQQQQQQQAQVSHSSSAATRRAGCAGAEPSRARA